MTQEDLNNFHAHVFGSPAPRQLFPTEEESQNDALHEESFQVENDDLGYYPDGVKRTLTDDQIAMFRHSEIYSIVRERQVRQENLEAEGGDLSETMDSQPQAVAGATAISDEEGELQSDGEMKDVSTTAPETILQHLETTQARQKRKREDADTGYVHGRQPGSRSARGFVRELDSATADDQILDYGDEPSTADESQKTECVAIQVAEHGSASQIHPAEGKKIWWPIIEAS